MIEDNGAIRRCRPLGDPQLLALQVDVNGLLCGLSDLQDASDRLVWRVGRGHAGIEPDGGDLWMFDTLAEQFRLVHRWQTDDKHACPPVNVNIN